MLMSEPLAAALLSGCGPGDALGGGRRQESPRGAGSLPGALLGGLAMVRPEYLGVACPAGCSSSSLTSPVRPETGVLGAVLGLRRRSCSRVLLAGFVVAPWTIRNAVALDRFVPISTGGGQVLFAGTYLPSGGDPGKGRRGGAGAPSRSSSAPATLERLRLEQILAALAAQRYPGLESDKALSRMGREQLWDDITESPSNTRASSPPRSARSGPTVPAT